MGIEPFLVASSVEAVMAQRLVRTICPHCKTEQKVETDYLRKIGFPEEEIGTAKFWHGAGCEDCRQLGYQGRKGIYELLIVNEAIRPLDSEPRAGHDHRASAPSNRACAPCAPTAGTRCKNGETTIEEVLRVTQIEEHMDALGGDDNALRPPRANEGFMICDLRLTVCSGVRLPRHLSPITIQFVIWPAGIPATFCKSRPTRTASGSSTPRAAALC